MLTRYVKKRKDHVFLKSEKNVKYVFSNTDGRLDPEAWLAEDDAASTK